MVGICVCAHVYYFIISSYLASLWFFPLHVETQLKVPNPFSSDWDKNRLVEWVARRPMSASSMTLQDVKNKYRFIELSDTLFESSALAVSLHFCLPHCFPLSPFSFFLSLKCEHMGPYNSPSWYLLIPQSYLCAAFNHSIVSQLTRHSNSSISKSWSF